MESGKPTGQDNHLLAPLPAKNGSEVRFPAYVFMGSTLYLQNCKMCLFFSCLFHITSSSLIQSQKKQGVLLRMRAVVAGEENKDTSENKE